MHRLFSCDVISSQFLATAMLVSFLHGKESVQLNQVWFVVVVSFFFSLFICACLIVCSAFVRSFVRLFVSPFFPYYYHTLKSCLQTLYPGTVKRHNPIIGSKHTTWCQRDDDLFGSKMPRGGYFHQNHTWMCLPDLENLTFSIPIFCPISHPSVYHFRKKSTQFWSNWVLFIMICP